MAAETKKKGMKRRKFLKYSGLGLGLIASGGYLTRHSWRRAIFELSETMVAPYNGSMSPVLWFQVTPENFSI